MSTPLPPRPRLSQQLDAEIAPSDATQSARATQADGDLSVEVDLADAGRIGVVVERVRMRGGSGTITERAEAVAQQLRPDGQALSPIEVDERLGGATLRGPLDSQRRFYEAEVTDEQVELSRKQVGEDGQRADADFALTRDQLGHLVDQLEDALDRDEDATGG